MQEEYVPPKVWVTPEGGSFMGNRPTAGAQTEEELPRGAHPIQMYSLGTPNGIKVSMLLEELVMIGVTGAEYDAYTIKLNGAQFTSGFVGANPNSKIPAIIDYTNPDAPVRVFESGAILLYLADKFSKFVPAQNDPLRAECLSWLFFNIGSAPYVGGGIGHFYHYAKVKNEYAINRFAMETKRLLDVLNQRLANNRYLCGDVYTIADMANVPWFGNLCVTTMYSNDDHDAQKFLSVHEYPHVIRWATEIRARQSYLHAQRLVTPWRENPVPERHSNADFDISESSA